MTDDPLIGRPACLEIRLRPREGREGIRPTRFGLSDIGPSYLTDVEAVFGLLQLLGQYRDVVLAQADDSGEAHDIHIGGDAVQQHRLLDIAEILAAGLHGGLGFADGVEVLEAVEQSLAQLHAIAVRMVQAVVRARLAGS